MGSKTFDGIWFICFSHDHPPAHVHGRLGDVVVIIDLLSNGLVAQSSRRRSVVPANAKKTDVRRIIDVAEAHAAELHKLWETAHGTASEQPDDRRDD